MSRFAVVFTGPLTARYNDRKLEGAHKDGHVAWERPIGPDGKPGKPTPCHITTFDQQRDFCRRNKCALPSEQGKYCEVASDGRTVLSSRGMPNQEV